MSNHISVRNLVGKLVCKALLSQSPERAPSGILVARSPARSPKQSEAPSLALEISALRRQFLSEIEGQRSLNRLPLLKIGLCVMEMLGGLDPKSFQDVLDLPEGDSSTEVIRSSSSSSSEDSDAWTELTLAADWCDDLSGLKQGEVDQLDDSTMGMNAFAFLDEQHFAENNVGAELDDVLLFQDVLPDSSVDFWCDASDGGAAGARKRGRPSAQKGGAQAANGAASARGGAPGSSSAPSKHPSGPQSKQLPGRPLGRPLVRMGPDGPVRTGSPHPPRPPPNMSAPRTPGPPGGFKTPPMMQQPARQFSAGGAKRPREAMSGANGARPVAPGPPKQMVPGIVKMYKPGSQGARPPMRPGGPVQGPPSAAGAGPPRPAQKKVMVWKTLVNLPSRGNAPIGAGAPAAPRPMVNPVPTPAVAPVGGNFLK